MSVFLDNISMPEINEWGDQPTLEIVRQLIEYGGFYFLEKDKRGDCMRVESIDYVAAMSHPGMFFIYHFLTPLPKQKS